MATQAPAGLGPYRRPVDPNDLLQDPTFQPPDPALTTGPTDLAALDAEGRATFPQVPPLVDPPGPQFPVVSPTAGQEAPDPAVTGEPAPEQPQQPAPPAAYLPAGPGGVVKTETERVVLSPESKAALEQGRQLSGQQTQQAQQLGEARRAQIRAQQEDARVEAQAAAEQAERDRKIEEGAAAAELKAQQVYGAAVERARVRTEAAEKRVEAAHANAQKDYWADKSTAFKLIQALLTFSSVKSSYTLGEDPNNSPFMRQSREAIERDKERKLAEVRASKEFLEAARRGPEEARQFLLDARVDIQAGTARQLAISLKKAEALKANRRVDPKRLQAISEALLAEEDAKTLQAQQELVDRDLQRSARLDRRVATTAVPGQAAKPIDRRQLVRWNGQDYAVADLVDARNLRAKAGATTSLVSQLDNLATLVERYKVTPLTLGKERAEIKANIGRLTGGIKESQELGALDKGVQQLVQSMISDPTSFASLLTGGREGSLAGIRALRAEAVKSMENSLAADPTTGFTRAQPSPAEELAALSDAQLQYAYAQAAKRNDPTLKELRQELQRRKKKAQ